MSDTRSNTILNLALSQGKKQDSTCCDKDSIKADIEYLSIDEAYADGVLAVLFPAGVPVDATCVVSICRLGMDLHDHSMSVRMGTILLSRALSVIGNTGAQRMLTNLLSTESVMFWQALELMKGCVVNVALPSEFAAEWLLAMADRVAGDHFGGQVYELAAKYADRWPGVALDILHSYADMQFSGNRSTLAYVLLGAVRLSMTMTTVESRKLKIIDRGFSHHVRIERRLCFHRSWAVTFTRTNIDIAAVSRRLKTMLAGADEEVAAAFFVLAHCAIHYADKPEFSKFALNWLESHGCINLPSVAKYHVTRLLESYSRQQRIVAIQSCYSRLIQTMLVIQPVPLTDKGTWQCILAFAAQSAKCIPPKENALFWTALVEKNPGQDVLWDLERNTEAIFWGEMQDVDHNEFVSLLIFSDSQVARRYGRKFFELLKLTSLDSAVLAEVTEKRLLVAVLEYVSRPVDGDVLASFFLALVPRILTCEPALRSRYKCEAIVQSVNMPGTFLKTIKMATRKHPLLIDVVTAAESYFEKLRPLRESAVNAFHNCEIDKAAILFSRKMSRTIQEGVEKNSLFAMMTGKPVAMLYGDRFAMQVEGKFGDITDYQKFSHSTEWPRLPSIDPDGQALKSLQLISEVRALEVNEPR